ncbi:allulose-6-phosphate 3-epimerase, partial [Candidatus Uhrbacteria bacterium]|nr:allulose-6-phosphate 3-epimerase [Candidatus Uhrbacteria bacterium]
MPELIPALLVHDALKFQEQLSILEGHTKEAQVDIMDGKFVRNTTFSDPGQIRAYGTSVQYELHLMVEDPELDFVGWRDVANVKRVIIHAEIAKPLEPLITTIKGAGWQAGIALNPETSWQRIDELIPLLDTVLVMTVHPG